MRHLDAECRQPSCDCAHALGRAGLDVDAGRQVLRVLDAAKACERSAETDGMHAEALVRSGSREQGVKDAEALVARSNTNAYALAALALARFQQGDLPRATSFGELAVKAGRGSAAHLVLALIHLYQEDFTGARRELGIILADEPDDVDATYDLALVAQKQNHYGEARSLYLRVLRLRPNHKEARYNLALLAHDIGAEAEAKHHLEKLVEVAPNDPLVATLRRALATPSHPPGQVLTIGDPKALEATP
jgi:tetratricopeptide (TPR) repeat protein